MFERTPRCGVATCHCASGHGHPVVCVGVTMPGGKSVQVSVPHARRDPSCLGREDFEIAANGEGGAPVHVDSRGVVHFAADISGHDNALDQALARGHPYPEER